MEDLIFLKVGTVAQIVMLNATIYKGTVVNVDTDKETATLKNYSKFERTSKGYIETQCMGEITIKHTDVLTCICTDPLWDIITGINTKETF